MSVSFSVKENNDIQAPSAVSNVTRLSPEQRRSLGIDKYYPPYSVDKNGLLARDNGTLLWLGKRLFDIFFSVLALVILFPFMLLFMLAIVIEDPSDRAIFKQQRIGKNGKPFTFYKLRSMCARADEQLDSLLDKNEFSGGKAFKIKDDPRVTKVGRFIRDHSIDELPQLINIIKGDMSIVGPRPPLPREVELYDAFEMQRLSVTPGLTCFWQILPNRHGISFEDWVALDLKYIEERTYKTDIQLILRTVSLLWRGLSG